MVENGVFLSTTEIYDPGKGTFISAARMSNPRTSHAATLLPNGKVLITGGLAGRRQEEGRWIGDTLAAAELYDPDTGRFTPVRSMTAPRAGHVSLLLNNGKVLLAGGDDHHRILESAEIYDPEKGTFTPTGGMNTPRISHVAVVLKDGRVLVAGGSSQGRDVLRSSEIFDPATGKWQRTADMTAPRHKHAATLLKDGRVLITAGSNDRDWSGQYRSAEIFDPAKGTFMAVAELNRERFKLPASDRIAQERQRAGGGWRRAGGNLRCRRKPISARARRSRGPALFRLRNLARLRQGAHYRRLWPRHARARPGFHYAGVGVRTLVASPSTEARVSSRKVKGHSR